ncbi:MAG: ABC transporter substrate-binding protein [Planctomycetes bacterium]|nr:ABC transporter substrate-binding protein [Planctomycetota bacterium]
MIRALPLIVLLLLLSACGSGGSADAHGAGDGDDVRIVSLSPALSRTVVDLGLEPRIVGRSSFCDFLDDAVPPVGDLQRIDYERLIELKPTHVLVQAPAEGIEPRLVELAERRGWTIASWSGIDRIDDIERVLRELPERLYPPGSPRLDIVAARAADLLNEIAASLSPGRGARARYDGEALLVYDTDPIYVFGTDTYLHEVLVRLGARNATNVRGWANLSLEDVIQLDPEAIIVIEDGSQPASASVADALGPIATVSIDAVEKGRVTIVRHPDALRPCSGVIGLADEMRAALDRLADGPAP